MKQFFTLIVVLGIMCGMISTQVQAQCNTSAPSVLAKWDFNSKTAQCNGAVPSTKGWLYSQTVPVLAQNQNTFCPNTNNGCGQALLGSKGFSNTNDFANALCLSGYWRPGTGPFAVSEGWVPTETVFKPEIGGNIYVEYKLPAGKSGALTSFSLNLIQKQYNGTSIPYEKQGVGVYRNGVLVYNQTQAIAASNVNGTALTFSFPSTADFSSDGAAEVSWIVVFGLVNRLVENGTMKGKKIGPPVGYDNICLNGTCGGSVPVAAITPATCGATSPNNDGKITLANFGATDKYDYVIGATYTGSQTYATATAIPAGGVIANTLPNPASATTYTVRIFNSGGCTTDLQVVLNPTSCPSGACTKPTATLTPTPATCTGTSSNSNASIALSGVTNGDKVGISLGGTYSGTAYAAAQTLTGGAYTFSSLPNPNGNQLYTVRVFNASNDCYQDFPVTLTETNCGCKKIVVQVLSADQADPNSTPNNNNTTEDDLATYEVCKSATFIDLKLTKTVSPTNGVTCPVSSDFVWTLTLTNEGTMTATNIQVADKMPLELIFVSSNAASGTTYNPISGWQIPSLAANASVTLTITTKATKAGSFINCAWVNTAFPLNDPDSTPGNEPTLNEDDDDCATITVTGPNVPTITKEFSPSSAKPGTPVRLTLKINNNETTPITLTSTFVDNLPSSPAQMTVAANPNVSVNNATPVIAAAGSNLIFIPNGTSLPPGLTQIQVDVTVPAEGIYCNVLVPGALQTSSCSTIDTTEACIEFKNAYIAAPLLKKAFAPAMVQTNQNSTLTITIENRNSTPITLGQDFKDELPAGLVLAGVATGTCTTISTFSSTNEVGLTSGSTVAPGTCTIIVPVTSATAGDYCNTIPMNAMIGEVSNGTIMVMTGNEDIAEACLKVVPNPIFDLALRKTLAPGQDSIVTLGATVNYKIRLFNQGTVDATNIQVTDYIPTGMSLPTSTQWTAAAGKATLITPLPLLKAGRDTTLSISLTVENTATGDLINRSEISAATGGTDIDSTPDDNPANDAGGKERSPSDDSIYGNGTGNPSEVSALSDEDDADPAVVKVGVVCSTAKMAVGIVLAPQSIRTQNDIVAITFGVVNNGATPLSNITFEGTYKLFKGSVGAPTVLTVTKSGDVNNDGIMQPLESWLFTATMTNTPYNPGDVFLICGLAKGLCGTDTIKAGNADLLFTAGVNMDVEITNDCVKPGEFVEADLIARLLIDEDAAQNPGTVVVGGQTITLPKRRFEARNMRITSPLLNGGAAFDPFNPPVGLTIQTVTDQGGADGGRNTTNILDEADAVNTARKPCSALGQNDVNCDFPDWVFKVKIQVPANYTGDKFVVEAKDDFDLYESKEDPAGSGTFTAFSSIGAATESDKDTINIKPNAGSDQTLACSNGSLPATAQLTGTPANGTWTALAANPAGMTVSSAGLVTISNADAQGKSYGFVYTLNGCKDTLQITAAVCPPVYAPCTNTIGGTVFNDFNNNGVFNTTDSLGVPDVKVYAYNCDGVKIDSTSTNNKGRYTLTWVTAADGLVRIEFDRSTFPSWAKPTQNGTDGRTDVQFVQAPNCTVDLGLISTHDYCQNNPRLVAACFVNGTANATTTPQEVLVSFAYLASGASAAITSEAVKNHIGSVWGLAYSRSDKKIYSATFLKRHVGIKGNLGDIYATSLGSPSDGTLFTTIPNTGTIPTDATRGVGAVGGQSLDVDAFGKVGRVGLGGLSLSEDEKTLYTVNLFEKKLYAIDMATKAATSFTIPTICDLTKGQQVPFAVRVWRGKVYVGIVCDASISKSRADLKSHVLVFDPASAAFEASPVLSVNMDYFKGIAWNNTGYTYAGQSAAALTNRWYPWVDTYSTTDLMVFKQAGDARDLICHPTPVLSDIEFDAKGNMILGFMDRIGHQVGDANKTPTNVEEAGIVGGDILKAFITSTGTWNIESTIASGGEFFTGDNYLNDHVETSQGGVYYSVQDNLVALTAMDPINYTSGGIIYLSNTTGAQTQQGLQLYRTNTPSYFGKSNGLSDVTVECNPLPIQIGNRVWVDTDKDGVQDPCEKALKDVNVALYKGATKIATTKTDANGEYYFSSKSKLGAAWTGTGADTTLLPDVAYKLAFGEGQTTAGKLTVAGLGLFELTAKDATASNGNDQNDSDAEVVSGVFCINLTTETAGSNHTFDVGFFCVTPPIGNVTAITPATCTGATANNNGKVELLSAPAGYDKFRTTLGTTWSSDTTYATATAIGTTFPLVLRGSIPNTGSQVTIRFYAGECCYKDTTVTVGVSTCNACVKPVAVVTPKTQTICSGATAAAYAATPSTGVEYKWFGPLTDTTGAFGTAISGQTNASFTPTGTALTISGTKYFAVIVNTTGNTICSDTAFVQLIVNPKPTAVNFAAASACVGAEITYPDPATTNGTWTGPGVTDTGTGATVNTTTALTQLSATAPRTFYIYYTQTTSGCTQKDSAEITVKARPVVTITGPTTVCETSLPVTFTGSPAGGTFTLPSGFPAGAATQNGSTLTLNPGFNIASLTFSYSYTDATTNCSASASHSITVNPKPNAGQDQTLACANPATNTLTTSATLSPSPAGGTWAQLGTTPASATISGNSVSGMTVAGTYQFIYTTAAGCKDTVAVIVQPCAGCVKPNAGPDAAAVCQPTSTSKLTAVTAGGTWAPIGSPANPAVTSIDANGNITGLVSAGIYKYVYSVTSGGQTCTDTAQVEVKAKPVIADGSATICAGESVDLTSKITGYASLLSPVWTVSTANGTVVTTPSSVKPTGTTTYILVAQNAAGCKDTAQVVVTVNPKPNAGQDQTLVCANGSVPSSVQLSATPTGGTWSALVSNPTGATVSSSGLVSITNATAQGKSFDFVYSVNGCLDTIRVIVPVCSAPCVESSVTLTDSPVCSQDVQTYSFTFSVTNKLGIVKVDKGTLTGNNPYTVSGIPSGQSVKITDSLSAICKSDTTIVGPNCNCNPPVPVLLASSMTACIGDTFPTLKATVVGLATVEWFSQSTGGAVLFTGLNYKPSGTVAANTIYYAQARSTDPTCLTAVSTSRVPVTINAQNCLVEVDLALKKLISKKIAQVGEELTYTIKVYNQSANGATNVAVTDTLPTAVQYVANSFAPNRGTATLTGNVINWSIGNIAANVDTVTLTYRVKVLQPGLYFNKAEITSAGEKDVDSTPGNNQDAEDDLDRQCFTVPIPLCSGSKVEVSIGTNYTGVKWFKDGQELTALAGQHVVLLDAVGNYTYTATNGGCPTGGCCPIIIQAGTNCCSDQLCVPFTTRKIKK